MFISASSASELSSANPFWLRVVRILCISNVLAIFIPWVVMLLLHSNGHWDILFVLLIYSPIWAPFAWVFWRLSTNPDSFIVRRDLILAASWAFLVLTLSSVFVLALLGEGSGAPSVSIPAAVAMSQLVLLSSSVKAYLSMPRNRDDLYLLIPRLGSALLIIASVVVLSVVALTPKRAANEASSVGSLRTIYTAQTQFAQDRPRAGFATSLAQLGPTPGAELIDSVLASGTKSGYIFAITSTTTDSDGRITKYAAIARPIHYNKGTTRSFLVDQSGTIHYTIENRAAATRDPALQ
jgi:type IV pilus assembly protein PilA